ncbi:MAG: hypothetical protein HZB15_02795 [Actinobacteria bacterium]|nr:hypothetical protein [Actinomycetota bacterium]
MRRPALPRLVTIAAVAALSLTAIGCSGDSSDDSGGSPTLDGRDTTGATDATQPSGGAATGSYVDECTDKQATGEAVLDATSAGAKALRGDDVEAARSAYEAYYDAYEDDVRAIVALSERIKADPEAPDNVVEAATESLSAGSAFGAVVSRARDELARADSVDAIGEVFRDFQDGLRGPPPGNGPQLPPALFSWMTGDGADCGAD